MSQLCLSYIWGKRLDRFLPGTEMLFRDTQTCWNTQPRSCWSTHPRSSQSVQEWCYTSPDFSVICLCLSVRRWDKTWRSGFGCLCHSEHWKHHPRTLPVVPFSLDNSWTTWLHIYTIAFITEKFVPIETYWQFVVLSRAMTVFGKHVTVKKLYFTTWGK